MTDFARLAGGYNETGPLTFTLYGPDSKVVYTATVSVNGDGPYAPPNGFLPKVAGTYNWVVSYSGDGNNNPAASPLGSEPQDVVGQGLTLEGTNLYLVVTNSGNPNFQFLITPAGTKNDGSTGVRVQATIGGSLTDKTYNRTIPDFFEVVIESNGNGTVQFAPTLAVNTSVMLGNGKGNVNIQLGRGTNRVDPGNGNDNVTAGDGTNVIILGDGNDNVQLGNGNNTVTLGNGNDNVQLGDGNNTVTLGNGNNIVHAGNGKNVIVTGNGNDAIIAGNGANLIAAGLGHHAVLAGNGSNILIDGSVKLTQSGDSLGQVLADWVSNGASAANSIRSRLAVTYNNSNANVLLAGSGLDWFFAKFAADIINRKSTDLFN